MKIPLKYSWIYELGTLPKMFQEALRHYGLMEYPGVANNPDIMKWATELGIEAQYTADSIPWCGILPAICASRSQWPVVHEPLWARNWCTFGREVKYLRGEDPGIGDIVVLKRGDGGHVGFFCGWSTDRNHVLLYGANQSDAITFAWMVADRILCIRRCMWKIAQPSAVYKLIVLDKKSGDLVSTDEQ